MQDDGGDRWQPPNLPNRGEVLIRPQAEEEDQAADQPAHPVLPLDTAKSVIASADVKIEAPESLAETQLGRSERSGPAVQQTVDVFGQHGYSVLLEMCSQYTHLIILFHIPAVMILRTGSIAVDFGASLVSISVPCIPPLTCIAGWCQFS